MAMDKRRGSAGKTWSGLGMKTLPTSNNCRLGLRRTFVPLALAMSLPNLSSVFLAIYQPQTYFMLFGEQIFTPNRVAMQQKRGTMVHSLQ